MAGLRLIGDPAEVEEVLRLLGTVAKVGDVSRRGSRYSETDLRVYAHVEPVVDGELVELGSPDTASPAAASAATSARRVVSGSRRGALPAAG